MLTKRIGRSASAGSAFGLARSARGRAGFPGCRRRAGRRRPWRRAGRRRPRAGTASCGGSRARRRRQAPRRPAPGPAPSSGIVWLQSQIRVVIGGFGLGRRRVADGIGWRTVPPRSARRRGIGDRRRVAPRVAGFVLVVEQAEHARLRHPAQHRRRDRVGLAVVVDVGVEPVHHVEVRIGEQLLHRRVAHRRIDIARRRSARSRSRWSARPRRPASAAARRLRLRRRRRRAPAAAGVGGGRAPPAGRRRRRADSARRPRRRARRRAAALRRCGAASGRPRRPTPLPALRRDQRDRKPSSRRLAHCRSARARRTTAGRRRFFGSGR